jgi:hypothetical protein
VHHACRWYRRECSPHHRFPLDTGRLVDRVSVLLQPRSWIGESIPPRSSLISKVYPVLAAEVPSTELRAQTSSIAFFAFAFGSFSFNLFVPGK